MADGFYIKKYWDEEDILFYIHFEDGYAVRQMEVSEDKVVRLSADVPEQYQQMADQSIEDAEFEDEDYISAEEFEAAWGGKH